MYFYARKTNLHTCLKDAKYCIVLNRDNGNTLEIYKENIIEGKDGTLLVVSELIPNTILITKTSSFEEANSLINILNSSPILLNKYINMPDPNWEITPAGTIHYKNLAERKHRYASDNGIKLKDVILYNDSTELYYLQRPSSEVYKLCGFAKEEYRNE